VTTGQVGVVTVDSFLGAVRQVAVADRRFVQGNPDYATGCDVNFETIGGRNRDFFSSLERANIALCVDALARHLLTRARGCTVRVNSETLRRLLAGVGCSTAVANAVVRTSFPAGTPTGHLSANVARVLTVLCEALDLEPSISGHLPRLRS
jgi:hypothetical protein